MGKIIQLPDEVISKIAAGEVVESPAAVVKELIENSIDARATNINIEISDAGLTKIRVVDNGEGMLEEDLRICFRRHATSKIRTFDDFLKIRTCGFRGEALYSIASVSTITIKSKVKDSLAGNKLSIEQGVAGDITPVGMPNGTEVIVDDIFINLPVRKTYFNTKPLEHTKVLDKVIDTALANPQVGFSLKHNDRVLLHLPKNQTVHTRLGYIFDQEMVQHLLKIELKDAHIRIWGYITKPQSASSSTYQYLYVNNRPIKNKEISKIIKECYGTLLDIRAIPGYVLFLELPYELVDINVHPQKLVAKFVNETQIYNLIREGITKTLGIEDLTYKYSEVKSEFESFANAKRKKGDPYLAQKLKDSTTVWNFKTNQKTLDKDILQIHNLYLLTELPQGLLVVDQHAAHERILYEDFLEQYKKETISNDYVDTETYIDVSPLLAEVLRSYTNDLKNFGIEFEEFGKNSFKITKIPHFLESQNIKVVILELIEDLQQNKTTVAMNNIAVKTIAFLACRLAIKGGDYLTPAERKNLLEKLFRTKSNYTCPHGRPVMMEISNTELKKMFKRLG